MNQSRLLRFLLPQILLALYAAGPVLAREPTQDTLTAAIEKCDNCHAANARIRSNAPVLDGLPKRYLEEQLLNFTSQKRGADSADHFTQIMISQLLALEPDQAELLARHYSRKKEVFSSKTVSGDVAGGERLFEKNCSGCHVSSIGRMFTKSPPIVHLEGPYILSQLQAFAADRRNFSRENGHKLKMAQVAKQLSQQEMLDITAYIKSRFADSQS